MRKIVRDAINGTPVEQWIIVIASREQRMKKPLTPEEEYAIRTAPASPEERQEYGELAKLYSLSMDLSRFAAYSEKIYQEFRTELIRLCETHNKARKVMKTGQFIVDMYDEEEEKNSAISAFLTTVKALFDGVTFNYENGKVVMDDSHLIEEIKEAAMDTEEMLSNYKSMNMAIHHIRSLIPSPYNQVFCELYLRWEEKVLEDEAKQDEKLQRYLIKHLREMRRKGENITPEEEELCVIPSYAEKEVTDIDMESTFCVFRAHKDARYLNVSRFIPNF